MRTEESHPGQKEVESHSDWLWGFLAAHTGEDRFFDLVLGRGGGVHPPHPQNVFETDRLMLFREMVDYRIELQGSAAEAAKWLFANPAFDKIARTAPFDYLEDGEFQALSLLHDWLLIACLIRKGKVDADPLVGTFEATVSST